MILTNAVYKKNNPNVRHRILGINQPQDVIVVIDIDSKLALPETLSFDAFRIELNKGVYEHIPDPNAPDPKKIASKAKERRDKAYESIEELVTQHHWDLFYRDTRGKLIKDASKKYGITTKELYKRLRRHWQRGMIPDAQLPDYKAPNSQISRKSYESRRGFIVTDKDKEVIGKYYRAYYLRKPRKGRRKTVAQVYILMLRRKYTKKGLRVPYPSLVQFQYWGKAYTEHSERVKLLSDQDYNLTKRLRITTTSDLYYGPGSEYQIDATRYTVYLCSTRDPLRIVGTPVVYLVRDCFSRMTVGLAVMLEGPSWEGARLALESVGRNKVDLCASHGINIEPWEWPCEQYCDLIKADRGELLGVKSLDIVKELKIDKSNTPPFRGDLKGYVEGKFAEAERDILSWTPGASYDIAKYSGQDYRLEALFNINEFTGHIIRHTLKYNNVKMLKDYQMTSAMLKDGIKPVPLQIWNWGIANKSGALRYLDLEFVRSTLLPKLKGSISLKGVYANKLWYTWTDSRLEELCPTSGRRAAINIRFDPRSVNNVMAYHEQSGEWIPCDLRPDYQVYKDCTLEEYQDELAFRAQEKLDYKETLIEAEIQYQNEIEKDLKQAQLRKAKHEKQAGQMSKKERLAGISNNRKAERNAIRREEAGVNAGMESDEDSDIEEVYIPSERIFEHLKKNLDSKTGGQKNDEE
jgi:hypothetical protein